MKLPVFIENSKIPVWLSKLSPIEINAISLGLFVVSRSTMSERTRIHETIHYKQWVELGFFLFPILYGFFWLRNRVRRHNGFEAYMLIPFEIEAYENDNDISYPFNRKKYSWWKLIR